MRRPFRVFILSASAWAVVVAGRAAAASPGGLRRGQETRAERGRGRETGAQREKPLVPPVALPDGSQFTTWEVPPAWSRTLYVNPSHPKASDDNPGTLAAPFRTIGRAAEVLRPGERVVIGAGTYRERVCPARGGTAPDRMIGYEAAPGAEVILKGSRVLKGKWVSADEGPAVGHVYNVPTSQGHVGDVPHDTGPVSPKVWKTSLPADLFPGENPFALVNLTDAQIDRCMPWAVPIKGKLPNTLLRGLIFQDGRRLKQVPSRDGLKHAAGSYWVEPDGLGLCVRPFGDTDPGQATWEVTVLGTVFAPRQYGLGYIRVKGLVIEQCGNGFPRPQQGALSTMRGHHWIIEDNTVRQCNSIGIDVGDQFDTAGPELAQGGRHIVRRNTVTDCGIGGIEGKSIEHTLIEENTLRRCGWQHIWPIYEVAGIKVHCTRSCLLRRNLVTDTIAAPGIWMDYANVNSRLTQNVIVRADCPNGGIFMEASQRPNLVDRNFVWGTHGVGIYQHDCDELVIANNFIAHSTAAGVMMRICRGRRVLGRLSTAKRNRIVGNILVGDAAQLSISDRENESDYNVFAPGSKPFDLGAWQKKTGWDRHSVTARIEADFDAAKLTLTWSAADRIPPFPRPARVTHDFFGRPCAADLIPPGPFGAVPNEPATLHVDPRPAATGPR